MPSFTFSQTFSLLAFLFAALLSKLAADTSCRVRGNSLSYTLHILSIALLVFAARQVAVFMKPFPTINWELLAGAADLLFLFLIGHVLLKLHSSLSAYHHIIRKKKIR
ncbi:hypothetical protein DRN67_01275 [Candidatus Micrarchaeota archaeon]|nr:MAG: hypothetical protein DRN67_01275 [Candidatus Micrarchaeota archaeon]